MTETNCSPLSRNTILDLLANEGVYPDKLVAHKDGSYTFRKTFFYRNGQDENQFAEKIARAIPNIEIESSREVWQAWPRDSYWEIKFSWLKH